MEQLATILKGRITRLRGRFRSSWRAEGASANNTGRGASAPILIIFAIGLVLGILAKDFTRQHIAIGYWDYLLPDPKSLVNMNGLQKDFMRNGGSLAFSPAAEPAAPACSKPVR